MASYRQLAITGSTLPLPAFGGQTLLRWLYMRYVFDDHVLDTQRYEFWCRDERIKLRPKVFQVLTYLIEHRDRVVSKDELLEQLWPNQFIGDGSLNACLMAVRKAVGDSGQTQHAVQNPARSWLSLCRQD